MHSNDSEEGFDPEDEYEDEYEEESRDERHDKTIEQAQELRDHNRLVKKAPEPSAENGVRSQNGGHEIRKYRGRLPNMFQ